MSPVLVDSKGLSGTGSERTGQGNPIGVARMGTWGRPHPYRAWLGADGGPGLSERPLPPNIPPVGEGAHG